MVRTVIIRVFEGCEGCVRAGRSEKSSERPGERRGDDAEVVRESGGVDTAAAISSSVGDVERGGDVEVSCGDV